MHNAEGGRIAIHKQLTEAGRLNDLVVEIIRTNVRVPEQTMGDVMANVACSEVGAREINTFMDEYGLYTNQIQVEGFDDPVDFAVQIDVTDDQYDDCGKALTA